MQRDGTKSLKHSSTVALSDYFPGHSITHVLLQKEECLMEPQWDPFDPFSELDSNICYVPYLLCCWLANEASKKAAKQQQHILESHACIEQPRPKNEPMLLRLAFLYWLFIQLSSTTELQVFEERMRTGI